MALIYNDEHSGTFCQNPSWRTLFHASSVHRAGVKQAVRAAGPVPAGCVSGHAAPAERRAPAEAGPAVTGTDACSVRDRRRDLFVLGRLERPGGKDTPYLQPVSNVTTVTNQKSTLPLFNSKIGGKYKKLQKRRATICKGAAFAVISHIGFAPWECINVKSYPIVLMVPIFSNENAMKSLSGGGGF